MNKRLLPILGVCALWAGLLFAGAPPESAKSFLWKVEADNGRAIHLLGSVHVAGDDFYPMPKAVEEAYQGAELVLFEVDLADMPRAAQLMLQRGALPAGTTLEDVLSAETWQAVKNHLGESGLPVAGFENMRPWFLALNLAALELNKHGFRADQGVDMHLYQRAIRDGKKTRGLESVDFQVELFAALEGQESEKFLRYSLDEMDEVLPLMKEVNEAWREGNAGRLAKLLGKGFADYPELYETLVVERNRKWLEEIEPILESGEKALVVVGSLHLVGEHGLVSELQSRGYCVTQR